MATLPPFAAGEATNIPRKKKITAKTIAVHGYIGLSRISMSGPTDEALLEVANRPAGFCVVVAIAVTAC
jgi:hypothetical protein